MQAAIPSAVDGTFVPGSAPIIVRSRLLQGHPGLVHGFSTRTGGVSQAYRAGLATGEGDLNLGFTPHDDPQHVRENRRRFLHGLAAPGIDRFLLMQQEHTAVTHAVHQAGALPQDFTQPGTLRGDGAMTDLPGVLLAIGTADCIPVLIFDPVRRVVAAFHAGWRGTVARIVEHGVAKMQQQYGCRPETLLAAIGPGIGPQSYRVSRDVHDAFAAELHETKELFQPVEGEAGALRLDLWEANRQQLLDAGLKAINVDVLGLDTAAATDRFFSYRAEAGRTGRMLSVIGLSA